jgi:hypothetical protein
MWVKNLEERDGFEGLGVDNKLLSGFNWNNLAHCREKLRDFLYMVKNYTFNSNPGIYCLDAKLSTFEEALAQCS